MRYSGKRWIPPPMPPNHSTMKIAMPASCPAPNRTNQIKLVDTRSLINPRPKQPIVLNTSTNRPITSVPPPAPTFLQTHVTTLQNNTVRLVTNQATGSNQQPAHKLRLKPGQKLDWLFKAKTSCMQAQRDIQKKVFEMTTRQSKIDTIDDLANIHNDFQNFLSKLTADITLTGNTMKMDFIAGLQAVTLVNRPQPASANVVRKPSPAMPVVNPPRPMGGLKIRPTSELMARTAPLIIDPKPVEIDDDDDCTVVEDVVVEKTVDPISLEPEVCINEPDSTEPGMEISGPLTSMLEPQVDIVVGDEANGKKSTKKEENDESVVSLLDTSGEVSLVDKTTESVETGNKTAVDSTADSTADKEELVEKVERSENAETDETEEKKAEEKQDAVDETEKQQTDGSGSPAPAASDSDSNSNSDVGADSDDASEDEDPETRIMIRRAMKESTLENVTMENRKVRHSFSESKFNHFLSVRVYMESDYGTGLPVRVDFPRVKIKEEPDFDIEDLLTGTMVSRSADQTSFGDAFSQFLNTSGTEEAGGAEKAKSVETDEVDDAEWNDGVEGAKEIEGIEGARGIEGIEGAKGIKGIEGAKGIEGIEGAKGIEGIEGAKGIEGIEGAKGIEGIEGAKGIEGIEGAKGIEGIESAKGIEGIEGAKGVEEVAKAGERSAEVEENESGNATLQNKAPSEVGLVDGAMEIDSIWDSKVQNGLCGVKNSNSYENQHSGIGVDHSEQIRMLDNETKHLSDVPLDELLYDMPKSPSEVDFMGFDDKLLN